jgi:hypothetical protein
MTLRAASLIPWLGVALIAVSAGAHAQIYKCVGKDGKTTYSADPCPGAKEVRGGGNPPAAKSAEAKKDSKKGSSSRLAPSIVPQMPPGKWKVRYTRNGRTRESETCGNPIDGFEKEIRSYSENNKWGCTMTTKSTGPRSMTAVYDCPSDRSPDGRPVTKGRSEFSLISASPQSFMIEMTSTIYPGYVMEGTRIGDCDGR